MRRHRALRFLHVQSDKHLAGLWDGEKVVRLLHMSRRTGVRPCFSQSSLRILVTSPTSPDPTEETKTSGAEQSWQKKKGEDARTDGRPNSFRIFRCRSRRDTRRRKQTLKWRQTFSLSVVGLASFIHPWQTARERESAHAASPSALLSFFHFHFLLLLFFLLDLPPEGFPLCSRSLHLHFC